MFYMLPKIHLQGIHFKNFIQLFIIFYQSDASIKSANVNLTFEKDTSPGIINKGYVFTLGIPISGYINDSFYYPYWLGFIYSLSKYIIYCFKPLSINGAYEASEFSAINNASATIFYLKNN